MFLCRGTLTFHLNLLVIVEVVQVCILLCVREHHRIRMKSDKNNEDVMPTIDKTVQYKDNSTPGCPEPDLGNDLINMDVSAGVEVNFPVSVGDEIRVKCADSSKVLREGGVLTCQINGLFGALPTCSSLSECLFKKPVDWCSYTLYLSIKLAK